jgi:phosphatidylglycerophosphate synthase
MSTREQLQQRIYKIINPSVRLLIKAGLTPNMITTIGLVLNIGVTIIFISGAEEGRRGDLSYVGWAGALILFAGLFDMLDGQVARLGNMSSRFGALYDSVLDRYSELILFLGICYYLVAHHYFLSGIFAFIGLIGSMMVSYTRARAESLGIQCKDGLMQRPERVIIIGVSALACGIASNWIGGNYKIHMPHSSFPVFETISIFTIPLTVMAILANGTAIGRLRDAKKALEAQDVPSSSTTAPTAGTTSGKDHTAPGKDHTVPGKDHTAPGTDRQSPGADRQSPGADRQSPGPAHAAPGITHQASGSILPATGKAHPKKPSLPGASIWLWLICLGISLPAISQTGSSARPLQQTGNSARPIPQDSFPVPPHTGTSLFYLQRTPNINTIICELNERNGKLDKEDPVHVFWIRYNEQKQHQELSFLQRHFAYGIKSKPLGNDRYELHFISYKKLLFYLIKSPTDNKHHIYANITGKQAILNKIFIKINPGGSFWSPNIEYLELKGTDPDNGKELMQRIKI